ncbi:hypothetical protein BD626DRAFT_449240 [Schizophyllum amplum]|uniref:NAD(P)-binding protein n=1 Tax=Schizophyllum amplum TaxID=97359 RepID=A0A550D0Q0_9AGAR|nr:hypothetical protein BD626DRAFT_449240 [Auriculariopsis ampla]
MPSLDAARTANASFKMCENPVGVFIGGTAGIGKGMALAFAQAARGNARLVIVGRNKAAAEELIASLPAPANTQSTFVSCDVSLMRNVHTAARDILALPGVDKINYLVLTTGYLTLRGRDETEEGIDRKLAAHYYARWTFVNDLMPALQKAVERNEGAGVMSFVSATTGRPIDDTDLGLKKTYSVINVTLQSVTYNDFMLHDFAARHPGIAFIQCYPGGVRTSIVQNTDSYLIKTLAHVFYPLLRLITVSEEECGAYMTYALLHTKPGFTRVDGHGDDIGSPEYLGTEEQRKKLWAHTVEVTGSELQ